MPSNPFESQIKNDEKSASKEISSLLTKAIQAKDVQKKADALTNQCSVKPPSNVMAVFEKACETALNKLKSRYISLKVDVKLTYAMKGSSWIATAVANAVYVRVSVGGGTHITKSGETLWDISKAVYGSGSYWPVIAAANKDGVKDRGDFILTGFPLKIPKVDVIAKICAPVSIEKTSRPEKNGAKKARPVAYPTLEFDLDKSKTVKRIFKQPGAFVIVKTALTGTLKAQKPGTIPAGFNLRTYEAEVKTAGAPFETSIKIKNFSPTEISIASDLSGSVWKSSISMTKTGSIKYAVSPKPVTFKSKGVVFEGNVGLSMEVQIVPDPPKPVPQPVPVYDLAWEWLKDNGKTIAGVALVAGAGALIVVTVGEDILTLGAGVADDPVSFAAAAGMFRTGLQMVR